MIFGLSATEPLLRWTDAAPARRRLRVRQVAEARGSSTNASSACSSSGSGAIDARGSQKAIAARRRRGTRSRSRPAPQLTASLTRVGRVGRVTVLPRCSVSRKTTSRWRALVLGDPVSAAAVKEDARREMPKRPARPRGRDHRGRAMRPPTIVAPRRKDALIWIKACISERADLLAGAKHDDLHSDNFGLERKQHRPAYSCPG